MSSFFGTTQTFELAAIIMHRPDNEIKENSLSMYACTPMVLESLNFSEGVCILSFCSRLAKKSTIY